MNHKLAQIEVRLVWIREDSWFCVVVNHMLQIGPVSVANPHGAAWALNGA